MKYCIKEYSLTVNSLGWCHFYELFDKIGLGKNQIQRMSALKSVNSSFRSLLFTNEVRNRWNHQQARQTLHLRLLSWLLPTEDDIATFWGFLKPASHIKLTQAYTASFTTWVVVGSMVRSTYQRRSTLEGIWSLHEDEISLTKGVVWTGSQ